MMTQRRLHKKPNKNQRARLEQKLPVDAQATRHKSPDLAAMQQKVGNQAVQFALKRQGRAATMPLKTVDPAKLIQTAPKEKEKEKHSAEVALDAKIPGAGSYWATLLGDFTTVADATLTLAECAQFAVPAALGGSASFAAAVTFIAASLYGLADAYKTGEKLAAVMGEAYGILYIANLKDPPTAPGDWAAGASFNQAARDAQKRLSDVVKKGGKPAGRMLGFLYNLRQNSEQGLNDLYYALVEKHLKAQFLFFSVRGRLYHVAMGRRLAWPEVRWYDKDERKD